MKVLAFATMSDTFWSRGGARGSLLDRRGHMRLDSLRVVEDVGLRSTAFVGFSG